VVAFASSAQDLVAGTTGGQTQVYTSAPLAACYAEGTMILTPHGDYPIETLQPGDQVVTAGGYRRPIIWTGHRHVALAGHPRPWDVMPVRIVADAFACGQPLRDLVVSPDHAVLADGVLIPIRYLLNGATIMQEETRRITWWHVELDAHDAILAEGLPAESYLDTGNRSAFVGEAVTALRPDFSRDVWARSGCAPLAVDGPVVAAVRRRLLDRMAELGHHLTADPAITLHAGGRIWRPRRHGRWTRFVAPDGNQTLRIRSRQFRPAELDPSGTDWRVLGIAVTALRLDGQDIQLDSPVFAEGWHPGKDALRWSDGDGALNVPPGTVVDLLVADFPRYHADATAPYRGLRVGT